MSENLKHWPQGKEVLQAGRCEWPKAPSSLAPALCYAAGDRVMAKHARWGWIPATVRWQSETTISLQTDHNYLITVPLEDVKRHNIRS
jgi:hypothetical protein